MNKDEVIALTLDYQVKFNPILANIADLRSDFGRLESELSVSRLVNSKVCDRVYNHNALQVFYKNFTKFLHNVI